MQCQPRRALLAPTLSRPPTHGNGRRGGLATLGQGPTSMANRLQVGVSHFAAAQFGEQRVEISATVSEAVAQAFENAGDLRQEVSSCVTLRT